MTPYRPTAGLTLRVTEIAGTPYFIVADLCAVLGLRSVQSAVENTSPKDKVRFNLGLRGQRAWLRIKATASEQRQLWCAVGAALNTGKAISRKAAGGEGFGAWLTANGFSDLPSGLRADAMWLAENFTVTVKHCPDGMTDPTNIRQWFRDSQVSQAPSPDLDLSAATPTLNPADVLARLLRVREALADQVDTE